ncbi:serine protease [Blastococcus sp. TML/M2B]|uniref:S1C family serine protease n=1 Tax=unclassified Blastococcus TaxID=2619396 RepID=UPI00190E4CBB|nr:MULTISPECIES: serine protease [unclassified Blastococcus]MBN1092575.1 serine protease [Blastococcus sp. TML/M2B]MBN1097331.1 serine protease [Blastococcus sp. TML/C7B]
MLGGLLLAGVMLVTGCGPQAGLSATPESSSAPSTGSSSPASTTAAPATTTAAAPSPETPTAATTTAAFEDVVQEVISGVVRFEVATCDGGGIGSGFVVAPHHVLTVAHVVDGGEVLRVVQGTTATAAHVAGIDQAADVALVETVAPLEGHFFEIASEPPRVTDRIAVLGFPEGAPLTVTQGTVNGLDRKAVIEGIARHSLIEHDAASTGGSSGGPVINTEGDVIGLHDAGPTNGREGGNWAVSGRLAQDRVDAWLDTPQPVPPVECPDAAGPGGATVPEAALDAATAGHVASTLEVYFRAINNGDFTTAFAQRTAQDDSFERFRDAVLTSQDHGFVVQEARRSADEVVVWLTFTSEQEAGAGPRDRPDETCTEWSLDYTFHEVNGLWLIAGSAPHGGGSGSAPCGEDGAMPSPTGAPAEDPDGD